MLVKHPPIVFLRHGETDWNVEGRLQGQRDIPLNDRGRGQAKANGARLIAEMPEVGTYTFVASPLSRARETMEIARRAMDLDRIPYGLDDRLKEVGYGQWEGQTNDEVLARAPEEIAAREHDKWRFTPPQGESYEALATRVRGWLDSLAGPTFVVAHGGVGRVLRIHLLGVDPYEAIVTEFPQDKVMVVRDNAVDWL